MEKWPPPLLGFNNNVRHHGRVFHIQTEDSGVRHARIVTHLFADGGRILKTTRTDYSDKVGHKDMAALLRQMMKEQHKAMFIALRAGELDAVIEGVFGGSADAPQSPANPKEVAASSSPPGARQVEEFSDADATQRIAPLSPSEALPRATGSQAPDAATVPAESEKFPPSEPPSFGVRPAPVFDMLHKPELSIFGEGVLSEKSLDDVILSYLADEVEEPPRRK